ncbi:conserved hypothetical protein [Anaeromyxobacter sp. K]|uniref:hypothetical protein n=1 Tax=Anaeromyxobacter sp. (strain K) TaxID=447217 RepID=UPI00015F9E0C|nr:hypothetical protein [Anaeromyxobacter sp. K]ACG71812.1 conserved hypothetical protein [Anaeromyxobacter sp. K]
MRPRSLAVGLAVAVSCAAALAPARPLAGPPYTTDDPEPVPFRHWEVYLATADQWSHADGWGGTCPHLEVNYGAVPGVQLHLVAPLAWVRPPGGPGHAGPGDTELGAKWRFVAEGERRPQVGVFPLVELPTGDDRRGLGAGRTQVFLPVWVQKSLGEWTTYGGGGYWLNPGAGNRNWWLVGWQAQRRVAEGVALGAEVFHSSAREIGGGGDTRFNVGAVLDLGELHHVLVSAGRALGSRAAQAYLAYQLTFGPGGGSEQPPGNGAPR